MTKRARRAARRVAHLLSPAPVILLYHRVGRPAFDPWGMAVTPDDFDAQTEWLAKHRRPMTMNAFVSGLDRGRLPRGAVAVTFDDGYLDNLLHAKPLLARHKIPATLFLATGFVAEGKRFWWDRLAEAMLSSPSAANWTLVAGGTDLELRWSTADRADPAWRAWQPPPGPRERALVETWTVLQRLPGPARETALCDIERRQVAAPETEARAMRDRELEDLLDGDVFALGAHSVTHAAMTTLDDGNLQSELETSREACARLQGRAIPGFAYPYGDMSPAVRAATAAAGFEWACSTEATVPRLKPSAEQRFALPRLVPPPGGAAELAHALRRL